MDVIEVDPARRVKLRIEYERLAEMHPSDLAEILEDLSPAEREAVFTSLDEEVAAEALEEVDPKLQKALLEKLDEEKIADIVEEMDPGAAADLLAELPEEQSDAILEEMEPEERHEVEELLEFDEDSAAGLMTSDFVYLGMQATVAQAVQALRIFDGDPESVTEVYLLDEKRVLRGTVALARVVMAQPDRGWRCWQNRESSPVRRTFIRMRWPNCLTSTTCGLCRWSIRRGAWWVWCTPTR